MPRVRSHGIPIDYTDTGRGGPALLLLPGWCGSRRVFEPLLAGCAARRRVLSLDWRGHGASGPAGDDFGTGDLVDDAIAVIDASGAETVVPVALSHAGWVAIELRRRLGARVEKLALLDWIVLDAPPPFLAALRMLQDPDCWQAARKQLFAMWLDGPDLPALARYVRDDMGSFPFEMWARAGREIERMYLQAGSPLRALAALEPPPPVLHLYAQPGDPGYLAAQQAFAGTAPWFQVEKLDARSHFPMYEQPERMVEILDAFAGR